MRNLLLRLVAGAIATALAVFLVPGIRLTDEETGSRIGTLLAVAALLGLVNALVRPLVTVVGFCLVVLTLGFFLLVINALMLLLASSMADAMGFGFEVQGFWSAFFGSIIISLAGAFVGGMLGVDEPRRR